MVIQSKIAIVGRMAVLEEIAKALNGTLGIHAGSIPRP